MKWISLLAAVLLSIMTLQSSPAYAEGLQDDIDQAVSIIQRFQEIPEKSIPRAVLRDAKGLAVLTVVKAGFIVSGRGGKGLVVARTKKGWSGPCAIGTGGAGFGLQIGGQVSEFVFILNTDEAIRAFSKEGSLTLGADVSVAAGPVGRSAEVGVTPVAAVYTYSRSQGLFAASLSRNGHRHERRRQRQILRQGGHSSRNFDRKSEGARRGEEAPEGACQVLIPPRHPTRRARHVRWAGPISFAGPAVPDVRLNHNPDRIESLTNGFKDSRGILQYPFTPL